MGKGLHTVSVGMGGIMAGAMEDRDPRCKVGGHRQRSGDHWAARRGSSLCTSRCAQPGGGAGVAMQLLARNEGHPRRVPSSVIGRNFLCCNSVVYSSPILCLQSCLPIRRKSSLRTGTPFVLEFPAVFAPETSVNVD